MSEESKDCPNCGAPIPENAPDGLCPKCLLLGASTDTEPGYTSTLRIPKPAAPTTTELAKAFPHMEILELIGQGGMGYVYKARQERLDRIVALKILPEVLAHDPAFAERFSREGRLLAKLNHPNIVTVHDFGVTDPTPEPEQTSETVATKAPQGETKETEATSVTPTHRYYYLVMEYVDGANLRQAMRAGRFSPEQALNVVPKVCDALQYAHDEGVLHRDIKPENILVDTRGNVKIADFGIAKLVDTPEGQVDVTLTGAGSTLGTPHYMAPEQVEQPSKVDHRADIYSLGVVFYEMLTGELPIGRFAPPSEKTDVNARVDEIVFRALEKEREMRQQSAEEIKTEVEQAAHLPAPTPLRQPREEVLKTAQCFITFPDHLQTFKARFSQPFTSAGDLMLEKDQLVFESGDAVLLFPFKNIKDVSIGQLEWWSDKSPITIISISFEKDGLQRTFMFRPCGPWPEPVVQSNRHCAEWAEAIREGVKRAGETPRVTPPESLPFPPAPKWIVPTIIATVFFGPLFGFLGAEIVGNGERHNSWPAMALGFALIGVDLVAVMFALMASLTFTTTRWALQRGNLHGLTMPVLPEPGTVTKSGKQTATAGTAVAFGAVVLYLGTALCFPVASLFRFGENGFVGCVALLAALAVIAGVAVWDRGLPGRMWIRSASLLAILLALPVIPFGGFFVYALAEDPKWNPATSEAVLVPMFILGAFLLPWAAYRLHRACGKTPPAVPSEPQMNPWPKRIFWAIIIIFILPVILFLVMLFVPYLAWNQSAAPAPNMQVALDGVTTAGNLVKVDVSIWTRDGRISLTPNYTGPALSKDVTNSLPAALEPHVMILPTPVGKEPAVHNRLNAVHSGKRPTRYNVMFVFNDPQTAEIAAEGIRKSFADMRSSQPHVRSQLFLFHIKGDDGSELYASLNFARARKVWVVEEVNPRASETVLRAQSKVDRLSAKAKAEEKALSVKLGSLPVTLIVKDVELVSVVDRINLDRPAGSEQQQPHVFSNRVVRAEIEIRTQPGVPAIGFNYQGERLEYGLLNSIEQLKVTPTPGVSQMAYQLPRHPQPGGSMLGTTMLIPLPDETAAKEVMAQLERIKQTPLTRMIKRDPEDQQLKLGFFHVQETSKGSYRGWFVFAPPREERQTPRPPQDEDAMMEAKGESISRDALVGYWRSGNSPTGNSLMMRFRDDGTFRSHATSSAGEISRNGEWRLQGSTLSIETEFNGTKTIDRSEIQLMEKNQIVMQNFSSDGSVKITSFRRENPEAAADFSEDTLTANKLVGTWESNLPPLAKARLTFNQDGKFVTDVTVLTKKFTNLGTWRVEDGKLVSHITESTNEKEVGRTEHVEIVSVSDAVFVTREVKKDGKVTITTMHRVTAPRSPKAAEPAAVKPAPIPSTPGEKAGQETIDQESRLVGTWEYSIPPLAKATITFSEDHTFVSDGRLLMKKVTSTGTWRIQDGKLVTKVEHSDNAKEVGKVEHAEILSLTGAALTIRDVDDDGKVTITNMRRVPSPPEAPKAIDRAYDTPTRRTFDLKHKLASEIKDELQQVLTPEEMAKIQVHKSNQRLTVFGPEEKMNRAQTFVTILDWPTGVVRRSSFEYPRDTVMNAARSFFYACAIEDDHRAFNKMLSVSALNRLKGDKALPAETFLDQKKMDTFEKELRETDWKGKSEAIADLVKGMNRYPLKSLRLEPGVAIGFGARYFVAATFDAPNGARQLQLSISVERGKQENSPTRYLIDNWSEK